MWVDMVSDERSDTIEAFMRHAARIQAAIDVLDDVLRRHRPASAALADWGKSHRFAGSGDRAAIGNIVFDTLRRRASAGHIMKSETARSLVLGMLRHTQSQDEIWALCDGAQFAPASLTPDEIKRLSAPIELSPAASAELPEWCLQHFQDVFGDQTEAEGRALAERAPVDLRVNALRCPRADVAGEFARFKPELTRWSALGLRLAAPAGGARSPNVEAELSHGRGWFEVQDEGSQIAAALTGVRPGERVLDLCAGAGGKTLAMAAAMKNEGTIVAYDEDKTRLRPIMERLTRAGATIVEPITAGDGEALAEAGRFDCVLVDAPCSGSGTWRRKPDAKWRLRPNSLLERLDEQRAVLATAASHVRPTGRLVYVTCSVLAAENREQITTFLEAHPDFTVLSNADAWAAASPGSLSADVPVSATSGPGLSLTPARHGTDGFYMAVMTRTA